MNALHWNNHSISLSDQNIRVWDLVVLASNTEQSIGYGVTAEGFCERKPLEVAKMEQRNKKNPP